ncbi:hypothetical protein J3Q64DRAFT_1328172 [Phycomyces blakesleeanus]|uniref:Mediator of RNA polymerase II transcription subunit 8 n=2 Tax=Phycomyces blakesleeanus TaxID=4837 RepID=A0A167R1H3_PHYB8|nr:hypothetical protein PHYBLDRAFT_61686 [Phycomyces blakesleeanus NRRL 1555(-)]OAD80634.1 hypothetical protein PHYBLDRAFT_61686 [Phycomyces blakesleeanus NRRL 1555(-)]|eukprot:XP_018298674.1 hypothetical protein PHYBLDRAFT_61686 [Phycomyces blakesleeanus NRRL 1555(-)]
MDARHGHQPTLDPNTIQELEVLRAKLWSLQETFSTQITYLKEPKYPFTWPDLLNKFNMLTAKFASLSEDFYNFTETGSNATLLKLMLHPYTPTTTEQETNILSVLLRTKLIPDIEKLEAETQAAIAHDLKQPTSLQTDHNGSNNMDDDTLIRKGLVQWTTLRQRHDRLAVNAVNFVADFVHDHRDTFLQRYEDKDEDEDEEMEEKEWEKMGFSSEQVWRKWKLECMMNFYSSGKEEVQGSDLKKLSGVAKPN